MRADEKRSSDAVRSNPLINPSHRDDNPPRTLDSAGAGPDNSLLTDMAPTPNGAVPVQAWNSVAPRLNRSLAGMGLPIKASGAANPSVPTAPPLDIPLDAVPGSIITKCPSPVMSTFAGETSP